MKSLMIVGLSHTFVLPSAALYLHPVSQSSNVGRSSLPLVPKATSENAESVIQLVFNALHGAY